MRGAGDGAAHNEAGRSPPVGFVCMANAGLVTVWQTMGRGALL
jgi:hypothetical protein